MLFVFVFVLARVEAVWAVSVVTVRALPGTPEVLVVLMLPLPPRPNRTLFMFSDDAMLMLAVLF